MKDQSPAQMGRVNWKERARAGMIFFWVSDVALWWNGKSGSFHEYVNPLWRSVEAAFTPYFTVLSFILIQPRYRARAAHVIKAHCHRFVAARRKILGRSTSVYLPGI